MRQPPRARRIAGSPSACTSMRIASPAEAGDDIVRHTRFLEQADVLECPRDAAPRDFVRLEFVDLTDDQAVMRRRVSFSKPVMRLTTVVLPAPFGPISR